MLNLYPVYELSTTQELHSLPSIIQIRYFMPDIQKALEILPKIM